MTLTQLTTDLTTLIGPGLDISNDNLATWINEGYASMCDALAVANPDYFTKSATADLATGIQEYDLPSDFERVLMVNVAYDGTNWVRCRPLENVGSIPAIMQTANGQGANTADPFYYILGGNIGLLPIPTASGNENLKLWYVYTPAALTDSSDSPVLPAKYHHMIKYSAYANFLDQDDQHNAAELIRRRFDTMVESMVEALSLNQVDSPKAIQITDSEEAMF